MKILIIGSGGREHAFCWKVHQSKLCTEIFIAPGNAGTANLGVNVDLKINDFPAIKEFCIAQNIDMVIVGPEEPLVNGIVDYFKNEPALSNIIITGPSAKGKKVVIESFLDGVEMSSFILTDGENYVLLPEAKDYKKIGEGDSGLNTGGMGAISPVPFATDHFMAQVVEQIIEPTMRGLKKDAIDPYEE